jgi:hypothetical protein
MIIYFYYILIIKLNIININYAGRLEKEKGRHARGRSIRQGLSFHGNHYFYKI